MREFSADHPRSPRAESFRTLRTNLQFLNFDFGPRSFVVTSSVPGEGKCTTAANLAISLAQTSARVVLVDGDLRLPRVAEYMGIEGAVGLTDVLIGRAELGDVLQRWGRGQLHVLLSGQVPPNPSELLGSGNMERLLFTLSADFVFVIIDAPSRLLVTDAAVISKFTGGAILVAASGRTKKAELVGAIRALDHIGRKLLGIVVTMLSTKGPDELPQPLKTVRFLNPTRILEARDGALAWRATTGPCPGDAAALPERTVDSGATWKPTNATGSTDVVSLQPVTIEGTDVASMIGQLASAGPTSLIRTYVAGDNYEREPADLGGAWFVHPLDHAIVHSPAGDFAAPCENVMAFAVIDGDRAAVLCNGQTLHVMADAAASWLAAVPVPGAMNLTESAAGYRVATVSTDPDCVGVQLLTLPPLPELVEGGEGKLEISGCFPTTAAPDSLAGNIALSEGEGTL